MDHCRESELNMKVVVLAEEEVEEVEWEMEGEERQLDIHHHNLSLHMFDLQNRLRLLPTHHYHNCIHRK